ncbi:MAG: rhodanese-like domain-containing protein [bacterium]
MICRWPLVTLLVAACITGSAGAGNTCPATISHTELARRLGSSDAPLIIDVRGRGEYRVGHIPGAVNIPHEELSNRLDQITASKEQEIVVHCEVDKRARQVEPVLRKAGFSCVRHLPGGTEVWRENGHPLVESENDVADESQTSFRTEKRKTDKLVVHFFGASTCGKCLKIERNVLKPLAAEHGDNLDIRFHDINEEKGFRLLLAMKKVYGVSGNSVQVLFVADRAISGYADIMNSAEGLVREYLRKPESWYTYVVRPQTQGLNETLRERMDSFSIWAIIAAGLADGVNPCAIATLIFLISFLTTQKRTRSQVLLIGLCFTVSVYATYLLLGLGAFRALTALEAYHWLSEGMRWTAVGLAGVVAILCFIDAFRYRRTRQTGSIRLQLPKWIKTRIHKVITCKLRGTQLATGAIAAGFLVTLLEAVCTGQVYLPTIVLMTKSSGLRAEGWLYLLLYNGLFVLPLLIIMTLAYFGLTWERLAKATQEHLTFLKVLLGVVLIALAFFLAVAG